MKFIKFQMFTEVFLSDVLGHFLLLQHAFFFFLFSALSKEEWSKNRGRVKDHRNPKTTFVLPSVLPSLFQQGIKDREQSQLPLQRIFAKQHQSTVWLQTFWKQLVLEKTAQDVRAVTQLRILFPRVIKCPCAPRFTQLLSLGQGFPCIPAILSLCLWSWDLWEEPPPPSNLQRAKQGGFVLSARHLSRAGSSDCVGCL